MARLDLLLVFAVFLALYAGLAYAVNGPGTWWIIDLVNGTNVFYGDDAYRFFLAKSAWTDASLYTYNFILPIALVLDGVVTTLTAGDLLGARCLHALLGALSLCLLLDSGRQLGIRVAIMLPAVIVMGLIPRFAFTTLSFYGEFWLGFFICLVLWLFVRRYYLLMAAVAGFLPLLRPEGIYFLAFLLVYLLRTRHWKEAAIMLLPGFVYAVFLLFTLPELTAYSHWRDELRRIISKIALNKGKWEIAGTYSSLLVIPAAFGFLYRPLRVTWPLLSGALFWLLVLQGLVLAGLATYEERYTYVLVPVLVLLWAGFLAWAWEKGRGILPSDGLKTALVVALSLAVIVGGMKQLTLLTLKLNENGMFWVARKMMTGQWDAVFLHHDTATMQARAGIIRKIEALLQDDKGIDKLVIFDPYLFYMLDPHKVPARVTVGYPATSYMIFHMLLNGQIFIQHSRYPMYSYLRYGKPDFRPGERRALYVDLMPLERYPYAWKWPNIYYELYLFSYLESAGPETDIDRMPMVHAEDVERAYRQWLTY